MTVTQVGVLIENFDRKLDAVADSVLSLKESLEKRIDGMVKRFERLEITTAKILEDTTEIKKIIGNPEVRISRLESLSPN